MRCRARAAAGGHAESAGATAVDLVLVVENARVTFRRRHDDGASAITEQHAGRTNCVVDDARHDVGANDQGMIDPAASHNLTGRRQRIGKRRTSRAQVEAPGVHRTDLVLYQTRGAREHHVGRYGPDDNQTDLLRRQARSGDRLERRLLAKIRCRHPWIHSSVVSTMRSRSLLVRSRGGT